MKTKELIAMLQEADPGGEANVYSDIIFVERLPYWYDGDAVKTWRLNNNQFDWKKTVFSFETGHDPSRDKSDKLVFHHLSLTDYISERLFMNHSIEDIKQCFSGDPEYWEACLKQAIQDHNDYLLEAEKAKK